MRSFLLAALRAAGITGLSIPAVWLLFGGVARSRMDAPPVGLQNIQWPFTPYGTYISFTGWVLLGLIFLLALAILVVTRRGNAPSGPGRVQVVDRVLMTLGAGVLAVAVTVGGAVALSTAFGRSILEPPRVGICAYEPNPCSPPRTPSTESPVPG